MNVHVRACIYSVHHQHAHMISDGHASMMFRSKLKQFASSIFAGRRCHEYLFSHTLRCRPIIPQISECRPKAHDDPGPL